jgi:murein L,D-transpeptidase YafK
MGGKTPEGLFKINRRNPNSAYHLSLGIDHPKPDDAARAAAMGTVVEIRP